LKRHPLEDAVTPEEFRQIVKQVQFCEISWPQCYEMGEPIRLTTQ